MKGGCQLCRIAELIMKIIKTLLIVGAVSLSAFQPLGANTRFIWTGGGTVDDEGFFLWSDTRNWQDGKLPGIASTGGKNAGDYDFSGAAAMKYAGAVSDVRRFAEYSKAVRTVGGNENDVKDADVRLVAVSDMPAQSDAERMKSGMMNPGTDLRTVEQSGCGAFKVLVYGNSIALHGPKPDIDWTNDWGMAASAREKDFAHLVAAGLEAKRGGKADLRIRNLAALERNFTTDIATVAQIVIDAKWKPDYVVIAIGENVPDLTAATKNAYRKFLADIGRPFASLPKKPQIVLRSPFWQSAVKADCTAKAAADIGAVYVYAGALGHDPENRAIGLFKHEGVANHPGDLGMRRLADLILAGFEKAESRKRGARK